MFFLIISTAFGDLSHKYALLAPLLKHSSPSAPLPENKSITIASCKLFCIMLNKDSLTLSSVGLVFSPSKVYK